MHFSIPNTQEFVCNRTGSNFTGYNIHINGSFHCCLRYKQIHCLHEQLKRYLPGLVLPPFPSKKLLPLTQNQMEQRRSNLERYIQLVGQDSVFSKCELLRIFLLNAQQESAHIQSHEITLDVYLMNGYRIPVNSYTTDCTSKVLEKAARNIDLPPQYAEYFTLYLMRTDQSGETMLIRRLMDFEAPYITQRTLTNCQIVIRKGYWDSIYDQALFSNSVALNLLYILTLSDIDRRWILSDSDIRDQLYALQVKGNKKEYLQIARRLPSYGSIKFLNATSDYPKANNLVNILIGNKELCIQVKNTNDKIQEIKFRITRMRCWRVSTNYNNEDSSSNSSCDGGCNSSSSTGPNPTMELSFEYLMAKNVLQWITICNEHAMLMSVCLQSIVDELLNQKDGHDLRRDIETETSTKQHQPQPVVTYIRRDGLVCKNNNKTNIRRMSSTSSSETLSSLTDNDVSIHTASERFSIKKKLRDKLSAATTTVFFKNGKESSVHNEAFEEIGDDDL